MIPETSVSFRCGEEAIQSLYDAAEAGCRRNLQSFAGRPVLVEGGGYEKIWLETQPMGGEMYALRHPEAGLNNTLFFLECCRADGRLPGSIRSEGSCIVPEYNKFQGFCLPFHALNLFYLFDRDHALLDLLKSALIGFDAYLHRTRELNGDGLLHSFCVYDTGEDLALRYGDAPCYWTEDRPPEGFRSVPMASMDLTSWSYACRETLAEICRLQGDDRAEDWLEKAGETAGALRRGLWNEQRGTLFDRDASGRPVNVLCHNPLRCMYWHALSPEMADRFVREHLLNPREFATPFPLPSVAVSDPLFRNAPENNWSGQSEGLTWQRAISALENYGYYSMVTRLSSRLFSAVIRSGFRFTQQYDPFTGAPSLVHAVTHQPAADGEPVQEAYGPTLLAVLEYIAHRWGIHPHLGNVWFSLGSGLPCEYEAVFYHHRYRIKSDGKTASVRVDGREIAQTTCGIRLITDEAGQVLRSVSIEDGKVPLYEP